MKFQMNRSTPRQRIAVPPPAVKLSGLDGESKLEIHSLNGAVVIIKGEMTAMDMVSLIWSLSNLVNDMSAHLGVDCGECTECGYCECIGPEDEIIRLPDYVLEEAGLIPGCKLTANVDDDGTITISQAGYDHDLTDVPPDLLEIFRKANYCLHELEERLITETIVYNGSSAISGIADAGGGDGDTVF